MAVKGNSSFPRKRESSLGWIPAFAGMTALLFLLTACGVKRELVHPSDIPPAKAPAEQQQEKVAS